MASLTMSMASLSVSAVGRPVARGGVAAAKGAAGVKGAVGGSAFFAAGPRTASAMTMSKSQFAGACKTI